MKLKFLMPLLLITLVSHSQTVSPYSQTNQLLNYPDFMSGVRYAYIVLADNDIEFINSNPNSGNSFAMSGIIDYFSGLGFDVKWGSARNIPQSMSSLCDLVLVEPYWDFRNSSYVDIGVRLRSCANDVFEFRSTKNIWVTGYTNITSAFRKRFSEMCGSSRPPYNVRQRLSLPGQVTEWTESKLTQYLEKSNNPIEGIYENSFESAGSPKYKIGIVKNRESYVAIYISGANNFQDWKEGEEKAKLIETATPSLFKAEWLMGNKTVNNNAYLTFEPGLMNLVWPDRDKSVYIKLFPKTGNTSKSAEVSGSGFAISPNGYIVTNYHVVSEGKSINIRGINGNFDKPYTAKKIAEDRNNDLAILALDDSNFSSLEPIPFTIASKTIDVGNSVYALGYPLRATMGDEIKLTNGIVSSKSGYQGDITSYQITVPIQPGNSGGPLFDETGNLVGIINAKHIAAENASYAIKASYLLNLIESLPNPPKLQAVNQLTSKSLVNQVKTLSKFVYIIEVTQ
ncbi:MAG TPA: serine protease [Cyclobacteriaceae bacterium]|nr:serine protease [Cyclobacteriaceae bacterium]HRJ83973.1 serine protease [Cyclobacteriaceae bacterium]